MNRADQEALYHTTNQGLIGIRQLEINYYLNLNVAFGTQAALVGGFTYGVFSQNPINYNTPNVIYISDVYWILSAVTIAFSVHVILCTMMMQVLGPGLALNGPIGSMAIAAEGMRVEQKQITRSFTYMMVFFALSTTMSFWQVMEYPAAAISTFSFLVASRYWYFYCERIYLRFYWDADVNAWEDKEQDYLNNESDPADRALWSSATVNPMAAGAAGAAAAADGGAGATAATPSALNENNRNRSNPDLVSQQQAAAASNSISQRYGNSISMTAAGRSSNAGAAGDAAAGDDRDSDAGQSRRKKKKRSLLRFMMGGWGKKSELESEMLNAQTMQYGQEDTIADEIRKSATLTDLRAAMASTKEVARGVQMEGYLTMRGMTKELRKQPWRRRYFTLTNIGQLFCYKSRQDYRADPKSPIFTRPFLLSDYFVRVDNLDEELRNHADGSGINFAEFDVFTELDGGGSEYEAASVAAGEEPPRSSMVVPRLDGTGAGDAGAGGGGGGSGAGGSAEAAMSRKMKPYRFQIALAPRDNEELHSGNKDMHRDWIVLRCDTEEELLIWVAVMKEISPSSFGRL